jgi:CheY-like chemotaxis protein
MAAYRLLWVEEDYMEPFEAALRAKGFDVERAFFLSDAVERLANDIFDLLLLDVMIPIEGEDLKLGFSDENTFGGDRSGVEFFRRYQENLRSRQIPTMVYTICGDDADVKREFVELGLDPRNFVDKVGDSNVNTFLAHVERVLRGRRPAAERTKGGD